MPILFFATVALGSGIDIPRVRGAAVAEKAAAAPRAGYGRVFLSERAFQFPPPPVLRREVRDRG